MTLVKSRSKKKNVPMFSVPNVSTLFICAKKTKSPNFLWRPLFPCATPFKKNPVHAHDEQDGF